MDTPQIAVIGAGPAGLAAAHFLVQRGLRPTVYEAASEVGGLAGAVALWGRTFDIGPHIVLASCQPEAVAFWEDIGGRDLARMALSRGMVLDRQLIDFPPRPAGLLRVLGPGRLLEAGASALRARCGRGGEPRNAGEFFAARYGERFRALVFAPFCEKYMGLPDREVDVGFARSLTSFSTAPHRGSSGAGRPPCLLYPRWGGTRMMWARVADRLAGGGRVVFGKALSRVLTRDDRVVRLCFADGSSVDPDVVVSTLPLGRLLQAIDTCPPEPRAEAGRLAARSTVLVYLRIAGPCFGHHYLTVFDHSLEVGRITNFSRWSDSVPAAGDSVLCMEYWCGRGDALWQHDDAALLDKAVRELARAGLCEPGRVQDAHVLRLLQSHPVLTTRHHEALDAVNAYLARFDNLLLAGRHATFRWDGQTDNIVAGMRLADTIRDRFAAPTQPVAPLRRRGGVRTSSAAAATSAGSPR